MLILASSEEDPEVERQKIRMQLSRGVDVLVLASCQSSLQNFYEDGDDRTPYLLFDRSFLHLTTNLVGTDDVKVGEMAAEHLIDIGRKRIAHIGGKLRKLPASAVELDRSWNGGAGTSCR